MIEPNPKLHDDSPVRVTSARVLFPDDLPVHRKCASLARLGIAGGCSSASP